MTCHAEPKGHNIMVLRKILLFNTILGLTLPKEYTNKLDLERGDYAEVFLRDSKTIVIKRHGTPINKLTVKDN